MLKRRLVPFLATFASLSIVLVSSVSAHVVVTPSEVGVAKRTDFSVGVPNEKDIPTTQVRLVIPEGLEGVTPYVKPGWTIETKKSGEGEEAKVTEITWKGGSIGEGLRDSFVFRAMAPADPTTLVWKAYQTYSDGTVVSWDQQVSEDMTEEEEMAMTEKGLGPYSETKVVNDLAQSSEKPAETSTTSDKTTMYVAYVALLLGVVALALNLRRRSA
jgi:uncharacterized protein YcnI